MITGIAYPEKALKKDLWNAIKESRRPPEYVIDTMAEEKGDYFSSKIHVFTLSVGHEVVRLPVAHCELNPIEMAWSQVKGYVKDNNKKYGVNNNNVNVHFVILFYIDSHLVKLKSWYTKDLRK